MSNIGTMRIASTVTRKRLVLLLLCSSPLAISLAESPAAAQDNCSFIDGYAPGNFPEIAQDNSDQILTLVNCSGGDETVGFDVQAARGGDGANAILHSADDGGAGGTGKDMVVHNNSSGAIYTQDGGLGMQAVSIGGNGGNGGEAHIAGSGGNGGAGGNGGFVVLANVGAINTEGDDAPAILGISQGGQGGAGGSGGFIAGGGGNGGSAGNSGDQVVIYNAGSIGTVGSRSNGITGQSIGGVGGEGGKTQSAFLAIGGNGSAGGNGGAITVKNVSSFRTRGDDSKGISARSIGGGGGQGGDAFAVGLFAGVAIGGYGGGGGNGGNVNVTNSGNIFTEGFRATAIKAQSIGGGGGDGGSAGTVTAGSSFSFSLALGGSGGNGGAGGDVSVQLASNTQIVTGDAILSGESGSYFIPRFDFPNIVPGLHSNGVVAQSIGGGGGHGGAAMAISTGVSFGYSLAVSTAIGGTGGNGGSAGAVQVESAASILTYGQHASGIVAQSVGGGGGIGGNATSVQTSISNLSGSIDFNLAGGGGIGGTSDTVTVDVSGSITTTNANSAAVIGQSIAGGGGAGGNSFDSGNAIGSNSVSIGVNMGGSGGSGESAQLVALTHDGGQITTYGEQSAGFVGHSIGGGGGHGGAVQTYSVTLQGGAGRALNASVGIGGSGGNAANGGEAHGTVNAGSILATYGHHSPGMHLQSIGGGGGAGGNVFAFDASVSVAPSETPLGNEGQNLSTNVTIGGSGGTAGNGGAVNLDWTGGNYSTGGLRSSGIILQSIGGGGGSGGNVHSFSVNTSLPTSIDEFRNRAAAAFSLLTGAEYKFKSNLNVSVDIGGHGAGGGDGGAVLAKLSGGTIATSGNQSHGLFAQSVGKGGGIGGHSIADGFAGIGTYGLSAALGGSGGTGGSGGSVTVGRESSGTSLTKISTTGDQSHGVLAHSVGGGGGEGGFTHEAYPGLPLLANTTVNFGMGGSGGSGGVGGAVSVADIQATTSGSGSHGVFAQSTGGGGGHGAVSTASGLMSIGLGGNGGSGNHGGSVQVSDVIASTTGGVSIGVHGQSIGGGGGHFGLANVGTLTDVENAITSQFRVSGSGGNGGAVTIGCQDASASCGVQASTTGATAFGILAQSIGGGGGSTQVTNIPVEFYTFTVNGETPGSGSSGKVSVLDTANSALRVTTTGAGAMGIVVQSIDSGGAIFMSDTGMAKGTYTGSAPTANGNGGALIDLNGVVSTSGDNADAIYVQTLSHAFTQFTTNGDYVLGSGNTNNASTQILLNSYANVSTAGTSANGISIATNSDAAAAAQQTATGTSIAYGAARAQTINVQGQIAATGTAAWGIHSTNAVTLGSIATGLATTHLTIGPQAQVTIGADGAGGIFIDDGGNAVLDIFGTVGTSATPAGSTGPAALFVDAGDVTINFGEYATINGGMVVTIGGSGNKADLNLQGNMTGGLYVTSNGGRVDISMMNATISGSTQKSDYDVFWRVNETAISIDTTNASVGLDGVRGVISGAPIVPGSKDAAQLYVQDSIFGTVDGAFNYVVGPMAELHNFSVDGTGGPSDYINVVGFDPTQANSPMSFSTTLYTLPTPGWKPYDIVRVSQTLASSAPLSSQFAIAPGGLAMKLNLTYGSAADAVAVVTLNSIDIDFGYAGLTGNDAQTGLLATAHVNAIRDGSITPDLQSDLYEFLLRAVNEGDLPDLQSDLSRFDSDQQYSNPESAVNSGEQATTNGQSCGGETLASVNPVAQGECHWAKFTYARGRRNNGSHRDTATGMALGHQFAVSDTVYLGFMANYETTRFRGPSTQSEGTRVGGGAILKFTDGSSFASLSTLANLSWADATRLVTLRGEQNSPRTARAEQDSFVLYNRLRAGHRFSLAGFDVIPTMEVDIPVVHNGGYTEKGAGEFNLHVAETTDILVDLHPSVQFGTNFHLAGASIRAFGEFGHRFALGDIVSRTSLANGFRSDFAVDIMHERDRSMWTTGVGLIVDLLDRLEARFTYNLADGQEDRSERFSLKVAYKF